MTREYSFQLRYGVVFLALGLSACISARNFQGQKTRILENTGYTLAKHQVELGVSALRTRPSELGANLGVKYGVSDRVMGSINLAHAANGLIGTEWKWNFLEIENVAVAGMAGFNWLHGSWVWALPDNIRTAIADVDVVSVPLDVIGSYTPAEWVQLNLGVGYSFSQVFGPIRTSNASIDAGLGLRNLHVDPTVQFYIARRLALIASAEISAWAAAPISVEAEADTGDGTRVGIRSSEWRRVSSQDLSRATLAAEIAFGKSAYLRLGAATGGIARELIGIAVMPFVAFAWRTMP